MSENEGRSLVIYFSRADENYFDGELKTTEKGNTEIIAEYIQQLTGADLFKVERKDPYPTGYKACCDESLDEKKANARPELKEELNDIEKYAKVYIGYPIYWGTMPMPMFTQLEKLNWEGKSVKCFCTHEGSGIASSKKDIESICKGAKILSGIAILGHTVNDAKKQIEDWV
ncbi:MAG: flavodoxin [Clostridia bacterium]|nr:flavodoxin [Clostridia bacterium]